MVFVKWIKPLLGWFKLNIDGSEDLREEEELFFMLLEIGLLVASLILLAVSWQSCQPYGMDWLWQKILGLRRLLLN